MKNQGHHSHKGPQVLEHCCQMLGKNVLQMLLLLLRHSCWMVIMLHVQSENLSTTGQWRVGSGLHWQWMYRCVGLLLERWQTTNASGTTKQIVVEASNLDYLDGFGTAEQQRLSSRRWPGLIVKGNPEHGNFVRANDSFFLITPAITQCAETRRVACIWCAYVEGFRI